jgi:hypothetical protein
MSSKHSNDSEFRLVPLAEDIEYQAARAVVADAEKAVVVAEERHRLAQTPAEERTAWNAVQEARKALGETGESCGLPSRQAPASGNSSAREATTS